MAHESNQHRQHSRIEALLPMLRCPVTRLPLRQVDHDLVTSDGSRRYAVSHTGIVQFEAEPASADARIQQHHYDRVAKAYLDNLSYPHTQEYSRYLDGALVDAMSEANLSRVAELCCGSGEAFRLISKPIGIAVGVDISSVMLEKARSSFPGAGYHFIQGDATNLPVADQQFDTVVMNGGIHHVNDRQTLFNEVFRILRPGGNFYFREPCSDFLPWRALRALIYRWSPGLDHRTEHPLQHGQTVPYLEQAGFRLRLWHTLGFLGFCLFMNSDILVFNRLFRFVPGIRGLTRLAIRLDDRTTRIPMLRGAGLQVVGWAQRPQ